MSDKEAIAITIEKAITPQENPQSPIPSSLYINFLKSNN